MVSMDALQQQRAAGADQELLTDKWLVQGWLGSEGSSRRMVLQASDRYLSLGTHHRA